MSPAGRAGPAKGHVRAGVTYGPGSRLCLGTPALCLSPQEEGSHVLRGQGTAALEASGKTSAYGKGWSPEVPGSPALTCLSVVGGPPPLTPAAPAQSCLLPPCQDLKKYGATTVVRVCEVTYDKAPLEKDGITVVVRAARRWRLCCCRGGGWHAGHVCAVGLDTHRGHPGLGCVTWRESPPLCTASFHL